MKKIHFNPMGPHMGDVEKGSQEWHEAACRRLQILWEDKANTNVKMITEQLERINKYESWNYIPKDEPVGVTDFCERVTGEPWETLIRIAESMDKKLAAALRAKVKGDRDARDRPGNPTGNNQWSEDRNGIISTIPNNTTPDTKHARRLRRDRPDIWQQVLAGEVSLNAAAIQAGFRKRMIQVPADDVNAAIEKLKRHYGISLKIL